MEENNLSESKALDVILGEFFGVEVPRVAPSSTADIDSRIAEAIKPILQEVAQLKQERKQDDVVEQLAELGEARLAAKSYPNELA
jgi:hypothetical protein